MSELCKLKEEIELLKKRIANYEERNKFWEPSNKDKAYYIEADGIIRDSVCWNADEIALGTGFKTEEEAIKAKELRIVTQRLKKAIWELNGGIVPYLFEETNFYVSLTREGIAAFSNKSFKPLPNWFYLESTYACEQLIKSHKADLLLYLNQ